MRLLALILFSFAAQAQTIQINGVGISVMINAPGQASSIVINPLQWVDSMVMDDDGYYNGFPMVADAFGDTLVGVEKKASGHAPAGPLVLLKSVNKGHAWTKVNIKVDGVEISSSNHSFMRHSTGTLIISYRVSGVIYFAYNDNLNENFTSSATTISPGANNVVAQSPVKMIEMPSGNVLFLYYQVGSGGNPAIGSIMESSNRGQTFSFKSNIYSHNSAVSNPTLGDWRGNETSAAITHNTGVDATCKMIALVRAEVADIGGTYPMFFYSSDGGTTWTTDAVNRDPGSYVDDNGVTISNTNPGFSRQLLYAFIGTNSPFDIIKNGDSIYVVNGERNRTGGNKYALKYITASPDGAFQNKWSNWVRPRQVGPYYNAVTIGASVDCGYPVVFKANNTLYVAQYDVSTLAADPLKAETRVFSEIYKLIP